MATPPFLLVSDTLDPSDSYVPYVRRRNTPAQLFALQKLFETTPHPTRSQRQALADEIGMELKSVTNWFQNKRQSSRKKSLSFNENSPPKMRSSHSPTRHRHRRSKTPLDRSKISLDHIAALSERPSLTSQCLLLTPRKSNVGQKNPSSPSELWNHMLSSPAVPPTSPDTEEARLAVLSSRSKTCFPLDWACLKARQRKWVDEDADKLSSLPVSRHCREDDEHGAQPGVINFDLGATALPHSDASRLNESSALFSRLNLTRQSEDVEAAITLLGFKTCS